LCDPNLLPGFVAELDGERAGLLTYRIEGGECEVVTIDSLAEHRGAGSGLIEAAIEAARTAGCDRVWLITTNDNLDALGSISGEASSSPLSTGARSSARAGSSPRSPSSG
jgi:GNAT superfamily N-acetyltransferase